MVRSLYSGVSGMKTHQTRMDVIGNNISNVSTYGYKSSRATFKDVYYQTTNAATAANAGLGGTNPTQVGYGTKLGSVDVNHAQSVMTTTGYTMDVAITGEGYLQVQDKSGNVFYTKAGMLDIDGDGNVVDINGNFVLGVSGTPSNQPASSNRIKVNLPNKDASVAMATENINGNTVSVSSTNKTSLANVSVRFTTSGELPLNQRAQANITSSSITIQLNENETFTDAADFQDVINRAITESYGGEHPAGELNIDLGIDDTDYPISAGEIISSDYNYIPGTVDLPAAFTDLGISVTNAGSAFAGATGTANITKTAGTGGAEDQYTIRVGAYSATLFASQMESGNNVVLKKNPNVEDSDSLTIKFPKLSKIDKALDAGAVSGNIADSTASTPSKSLGLGGTAFILKDGTEGGPQSVADLTSISISTDGVISAIHPTEGTIELGRIDLATFENPKGLTQIGNTYFSESVNSGSPKLAIAGQEGTGEMAAGTLETSNVDLSNEMADMITTQRGFQANSRIITVSDTMLEELINLKR